MVELIITPAIGINPATEKGRAKMTKKYTIKTRKVIFVLNYGQNSENKWVQNGCATYIEGPKGEKFMISKCCATLLETKNWCVQVHLDRKGNKCKPYAMARDGRRLVTHKQNQNNQKCHRQKNWSKTT